MRQGAYVVIDLLREKPAVQLLGELYFPLLCLGFREFLRLIWTVICQLTVRNTVDTRCNQHEACQITASCEVLELFKEITLINHKLQLTIV